MADLKGAIRVTRNPALIGETVKDVLSQRHK